MTTDAYFHLKFGIIGRARATRNATSGSAVAMSAYQRCTRAVDADGCEFDFRRKRKEHIGGTILWPYGAPDWAADPVTLWQRAEAAEKRSDAQLARIAEFAIPRGVPDHLAMDFAAFVAEPLREAGMIVQLDLHDTPAADGGRNRHCHLQMTLRPIEGEEFAKKKERAWNTMFQADGGKGIRTQFADQMNRWFDAHEIDAVVDPRTNAQRGLLPAEAHVGRAAIEAYKMDPDRATAFGEIVANRKKRQAAKDAAADIAELDAEIEMVDDEIKDRRLRRGSVSPISSHTKEARRLRLHAMIIARRYDKLWVPAADAATIAKMTGSPSSQAVTIVLQDGSRLIDRGDQIDVHGQTDAAIQHAIKLIERLGWTDGVELSGTAAFRLQVAVDLLDRRPPIPVVGLSERDKAKIDRELSRRSAERQPSALAFVRAERTRQDARLRSAPILMRAKIADRIDMLDRAMAAIRRGDREMITAAHDKDAAAIARLTPAPKPLPDEPAPEEVRSLRPSYRLTPKFWNTDRAL